MSTRATGCALAILLGPACADPPAPVVVPTELTARWEILPHRLSVAEVTMATSASDRISISAQWDGGSFGAIDTPRVWYGASVWRSHRLAAEEVSVTLAIPPGSEVGGEPFSVAEVVSFDVGSLAGATAVTAVIRGYRVATDDYLEPPPFETDPEQPYDPIEGYTTQGLGIALGDAVLAGDRVTVEVRVRNSLGISDRPDMNAAIPQATTWMRVDLTLIGSFDGGAATSAATSYFISAADYGKETVHEHALPADQRIDLAGVPGLPSALFGLRAVDYWLNLDGHHDPDCVVIQDEINSWGEPVSGPGRYVRELSARLHDTGYDPGTGAGYAHADLMLSNSSLFKEVGNLCLGVRAEVVLFQVADDSAAVLVLEPTELELYPGEPGSVEVGL